MAELVGEEGLKEVNKKQQSLQMTAYITRQNEDGKQLRFQFQLVLLCCCYFCSNHRCYK
ncbi:conserved hypothetical protein [Ricinus communis]|uniref:Uncharacterized protein n=1 Tax=Ricinus communis TaxID=3988 RepID=B9T5Y5_RICCO|nr:conserved hypothetical protein [Ricinus communis]